METTSDGHGILSIKLLKDNPTTVKTWNNSLSDIGSDTLIAPGSTLYEQVAHLAIGNKVIFSGSFAAGKLDYVKEASVTESGAMNEPELIFTFASVSTKLNQPLGPLNPSPNEASPSAETNSSAAQTSQAVLLHKTEPLYSQEARKAKFNGDIRASIVIDENGNVSEVHILDSPGLGLEENIITAVRQWKFKPAMKDGVVVSARATVNVAVRCDAVVDRQGLMTFQCSTTSTLGS